MEVSVVKTPAGQNTHTRTHTRSSDDGFDDEAVVGVDGDDLRVARAAWRGRSSHPQLLLHVVTYIETTKTPFGRQCPGGIP